MLCTNCNQNLKDKYSIMCDKFSRTVHLERPDLNSTDLTVMDLKCKGVLRYYCEDYQSGIIDPETHS